MAHFSFDFWNTVAKPNPVYAAERAKFLAAMFNVDVEKAKVTYTEVKQQVDLQAERYGIDYGFISNIDRLFRAFGENQSDPGRRFTVIRTFDSLFAEHPPTVDPALVEQLDRARRQGITMSIGSNTNYIRGAIIRKVVLHPLPFTFAVFSDEVRCAKPNIEFFRLIGDKARKGNLRIKDNSEILHIGDHAVCDGKGAHDAGMASFIVNNADQTAHAVKLLLDA